MKILLIDDEIQLRDLLRGILHAACPEAEILQAADLYYALDLVTAADVILCDGHFPKGSMVTTWEVQQNPWLSVWAYAKGKRFALLTGDPLAEARARALGITVFAKPYRIADVLAFVRGEDLVRHRDTETQRKDQEGSDSPASVPPCLSGESNPVVIEMDRQNERIANDQGDEALDWRRRRKMA